MNARSTNAASIKKLPLVVMLVLGLFIASAGDLFAMRCGNALVLAGDRYFEVLNKCGEPDFVAIDGWAYNFGPTQFIHYLRFDNGRLTQIELGDYGWDEGDSGGMIGRYFMGSLWPWHYLPPAPPDMRPSR